MLEWIILIGRILLLVYIGCLVFVYFNQRRYLYYPSRQVSLTPAYFELGFEDLRLSTADGGTIGAWYVPADPSNRLNVCVILCHGNGGCMENRLDMMVELRRLGLDVLAFDYRGYGDSTGEPTEKGILEDARAVWRYATVTRALASSNIVIMGESLGGAVAVALAREVGPGALIVESSFTSASEMGQRMFPVLPVGLLCKDRFDSLSRIGGVTCPVLVAHGMNDRTIPYDMGRRLFAAAREPKIFLELSGDHNDGGLMAETALREKVLAFILSRIAMQSKGG